MLEIFITFSFVNAVFFTFMGCFIFLNDRRSKSNILYSLFCASVAGWSTSYILWLSSGVESQALFWARVLNLFAVFIPMFFCHWVLVLLGIDKRKSQKFFLFLAYSATAFFTAVSFHPYYVRGVEPALFFPYWPMPGKIHPYYLIISWGIILFYTYWRLFRGWQESSGSKKIQLKYILISMPIGFGGGFTNFFLWYGIPFPPWFNIFVSVWGLSFLYIVFRYSFMEVRSILSRTGVYILAFLPIILMSALLSYALPFIKNSLVSFSLEALFAFLCIFSFNRFLRFVEKIASRYFYNSFYGLQEKISFLSKKINQMIEMEKLSGFMMDSLRNSLKTEKAAIVLWNSEKDSFFVQKQNGLSKEIIMFLLDEEEGFLPFWLKKSKKSLLKSKIKIIAGGLQKEEKKSLEGKFEKLEEEMEKSKIAAAIPLFVENKLIGIIFLGEKEAGKIYSGQEMDLLESFMAQASVAFNNSLAYEELENRKEELERFYKLTIGRELRMAELKDQIKKLEEKEEINNKA
ncbi:MAG: histidine kinase N-terminal 7TM domain-containing protein [Candidatus Pacebacteria bacterium]|nr:histidine kinase N-terminal 7TM domain-containing protein [Candidatus Paceibacterota bacterium]